MSRGTGNNLIPALLLTAQICLLVFFAFARLIDNDEGFYLSAGQGVSEGKAPYIDFFYPQMPYLPYIFSPFAGHGFATLYATRLASVAAAVMTTLIFYLLLIRVVPRRNARNLALAMYVFSGMIISWHSVAKPYPWIDLCLLGGFYFLVRFFESNRLRYVLLCGIVTALAVNIRSVMAPVALLYLTALAVGAGSRRSTAVITYVAGALAVSIPALTVMVADTQRFFFDNIGFHLMRNPEHGLGYALMQKLSVASRLIINPQVLLLLIAGAAAYLVRDKSGRRWNSTALFTSPRPLAGIIALTISVIYFLPNPVLQQYFVQAIPFLLLASPKGIDHVLHRSRNILKGVSNRRLVGILTGVYILGMVPYVVIFVGAVREYDGFSTPGNLRQVCADLDENTDEPILTELPIVSVLCRRHTFDGAEYLGFEYPLPLNEEEMNHYRLATNSMLERILDSGAASHYVVMNAPPEELADAAARNYMLVNTYDRLKVYRRKM